MSILSLDDIVRDFYTVSSMDISIVDRDFRSLAIRRGKDNICSALHRDRTAVEKCKASDIEQLNYVKSARTPILYSCPFGITEAIIPILRDSEPVGYIISTLGIRARDVDNIRNLCAVPVGNEGQLSELINGSEALCDEKIASYFNMLKIMAEYVASDSSLISESESIGRLIKRFIKGNIARKLTLHELARNLHCSTVTLTEHFKAEFGITINGYITSKRMELAEKLMLSTDKPLREISVQCGFADVEYFSRTFKKHHGKSPALWRKQKGNKTNDNP